MKALNQERRPPTSCGAPQGRRALAQTGPDGRIGIAFPAGQKLTQKELVLVVLDLEAPDL
jgi:hypothetical protein